MSHSTSQASGGPGRAHGSDAARAARCAGCGAVVRVEILRDALLCDHCGTYTPHEPSIAERVRAARAVLASLDVRSRQLDEVEARALGHARGSYGCFHAILALVVATQVTAAWVLLASLDDTADPWSSSVVLWVALPVVATFAFSVGPALLYSRRLRRRRDALEEACAAVPPVRPGAPAGCHVCGAPLGVQGTGAIVRCGHCAADNVVSSSAMQRAAARAIVDAEGLEAAVRRHGQSARGAALRGVVLLPVFALGVALFGCVAWGAAVLAAVRIESEVPPTTRLVRERTADGECLFDSAGRPPGSGQYLAPAELVGRRYRVLASGPNTARDVQVVAVYVTPFFPGTVYARALESDGRTERLAVGGALCEPTTPTAVVPSAAP